MLALEKTEAILLTTKQKLATFEFEVFKIYITPSKSIKYISVWLDTDLKLGEQMKKTIVESATLSMPYIRWQDHQNEEFWRL